MAFEAMGRPFESDRAYDSGAPATRVVPFRGGKDREKRELRTQDTPQVRNPIKPPSPIG